MNNLESRREFCNYMNDRIFNKLNELEEYELLTFASCGIYLRLRSIDILKLQWEQFDFENMVVKDICITKNNMKTDIDMHERLRIVLKTWQEKSNDKIKLFPNLKRYGTAEKIGEIIGDVRFKNHDLRSIGLFVLE